ncbi:hypothetical protein [Staphylococcus chromogenes]|uniref:hypothetical protein n=1 Tax=Staphylococcus chromogenes TaxID=46126 RepID=UPI000D1AAF48|nr:hypothetical protein [Staphylococcus chromogenes]PTF70271.1 hypothetical protein BUY01_05535 [Staphylococcus chromogenes]PTG85391.1 hypothetical protein BU665_01460 [Staphylococcus chromogenes]
MNIEKVVYNVDNGQPFLVLTDKEGESVYPEFEHTEVPVPDGLYQPFYFDQHQNKWIGTSKEEFEKQHEPEEVAPNKDMLVAELMAQIAAQDLEIKNLQKVTAELALSLAAKEEV